MKRAEFLNSMQAEHEEQEYWEEIFPESNLLFTLFAYYYC